MVNPVVVSVVPGSPAERAGIQAGDEVASVNGQPVRDVIQWRSLADDADPELVVLRGGLEMELVVVKDLGDALGIEVQSALFDQLRTCDNHCSFCFIYQLPPGLRSSLYQKDDDYRLSFLYGNFTTLTRFTEADLERVITERLSPLNVSIHATDPEIRSDLLRNRRGATSLRWLRALLDHGIEVHGQLVICPGVNDGPVLDDTLCGVLDQYPELASLHAVPLGVSKYSSDQTLRPHSSEEAALVVDQIEQWQSKFLEILGRRLVFAADEYYLMAGRPFPKASSYEDFAQHENGIGMVRRLEMELLGQANDAWGPANGFFAWVEGAPAAGYRAPRLLEDGSEELEIGEGLENRAEAWATGGPVKLGPDAAASGQGPSVRPVTLRRRSRVDRSAPVAILTGEYGARVLNDMLPGVVERLGRRIAADDVRVVPVKNYFFGGNVAVAGLMVGQDLAQVLQNEPEGHRYLLPDVCLSKGLFLDGMSPTDLPRAVEIVPTNGIALREALRTIPSADDRSLA